MRPCADILRYLNKCEKLDNPETHGENTSMTLFWDGGESHESVAIGKRD